MTSQTLGWKIVCISQDIPVDKKPGCLKLKDKSEWATTEDAKIKLFI